MTLVELQKKLAELSLEERLQLAAFLAELDEQNETDFRQLVSTRMRAMDAGKKVAMEEFEAEHRRRASAGKD